MTAALWALVWLPMGVVFFVYASPLVTAPDVVGPFKIPWFVTVWTAWGAISGAVFAGVLASAEAGRALRDLSVRRIALWGAIGSISLPLVLTGVDFLQGPEVQRVPITFALAALMFSGVLGATCGAGTLAIARRAPNP